MRPTQYFNDPEATRKAFRGGHFGSGDLAVKNPDGSISILDRSKDLIISGGEVSALLSHFVLVWIVKYPSR